MTRDIREFMRRVAEDGELRARVAESGSLEEAYAASGAEAAGFTLEEFTEFIAEAVPASDELSFDDLSQVAGGLNGDVMLPDFHDMMEPDFRLILDDCRRDLPPDLRPAIDPSMFKYFDVRGWSGE